MGLSCDYYVNQLTICLSKSELSLVGTLAPSYTRHAGYLSHRGKNERIAKLHNLLKLPPPMPKVEIPIQLRVLIKTGIDISLCPICKTGKLILIKTSICINGILIDVKTIQNKGSPLINIDIP